MASRDPLYFGKLLADTRSGMGLSLRQAAKVCGVSAATIYRVESGHCPDVPTLWRLCRFAKIPALWALEYFGRR